MKYAIVIPDGCADEPQAPLGDRTPLQAANLPNIDRRAPPGVSYRNLLVCRGRGPRSVFGDDTRTQPPHDIPDKPIADYLPSGTGAGLLQRLMANSRDVFADHPVNQARRAAGKRDATQVWLWGQGRAAKLT